MSSLDKMPSRAVVTVILMLAMLVGSLGSVSGPEPRAAAAGLPNIILIVTDDLDSRALDHMPNIEALLRQQGTTFANFLVSMPACCPSRASIFRGQYVHNHGVLGNKAPNGGFEAFLDRGNERSTVATWLQDAGYRTGLFGKYLNEYDEIMPKHVPPGWDEWYAWAGLDKYFNFALNENGEVVEYFTHPDHYQTDVLAAKARKFAQDSVARGTPFFAYIAPFAPHEPSVPAPRHRDAFADATAPRVPSFNEGDLSDKPWLVDHPSLSADQIAEVDAHYRQRLQSMLAVDEMVASLIATLDDAGALENTYLFFTSDNGWLSGEHRLAEGKGLPYEEAIRVPLIVRGPGLPVGRVETRIASNIDLAPTFAALAEAPVPSFVDGRSLLPLLLGDEAALWRESVLVEMAPRIDPERQAKRAEKRAAKRAARRADVPQSAKSAETPNAPARDLDGGSAKADDGWNAPRMPPFRVLRTEGIAYIEFLPSGDGELYYLPADPFQLENLIQEIDADTRQQLARRVAALAGCAAASCRYLEDAPLEVAAPALLPPLNANEN